ncbi:MAG: hypothetical protein EBQ80_02840 [Proteobacteria bacterium]|nr:hypothetical protein [Pseudomonadota bacterium]
MILYIIEPQIKSRGLFGAESFGRPTSAKDIHGLHRKDIVMDNQNNIFALQNNSVGPKMQEQSKLRLIADLVQRIENNTLKIQELQSDNDVIQGAIDNLKNSTITKSLESPISKPVSDDFGAKIKQAIQQYGDNSGMTISSLQSVLGMGEDKSAWMLVSRAVLEELKKGSLVQANFPNKRNKRFKLTQQGELDILGL